jgi:predicted KAP-like P-loop ATPase
MSKVRDLITFVEAARLLPRPVHPNTIRRWADNGLGGVILQSEWQVGKRYTTAEWLAAFVAECESRRYLQDQLNRESFERALAEKFRLTKSTSPGRKA